uniref:Uncharacterized protein n=1 Tax=Cacopsylla melanoneura TaxID=428564 RepID=A0A8D8S2Q0_9HEMI
MIRWVLRLSSLWEPITTVRVWSLCSSWFGSSRLCSVSLVVSLLTIWCSSCRGAANTIISPRRSSWTKKWKRSVVMLTSCSVWRVWLRVPRRSTSSCPNLPSREPLLIGSIRYSPK